MTMKSVLNREAYVALHAQTWKFRVVKYIVLLAIGWIVYALGGWNAVGVTFGVLLIIALGVHFFFRWASKGWTQSWGPYKKLRLPDER